MMKKNILFALLIILFCSFGQKTVFAQTGVSLEVEIKNIENSVAGQGISAAERHDALVRLARLRQLSGDYEGAARNWFEAAAAKPDMVDDEALLSCAYCLAAMGEWDRAATALEPLLSKLPRARFLDTSIKAIKTGDLSALAALADNPAYSQIKAEVLFVLWKLTQSGSKREAQNAVKNGTAEKWRQRLIDEFPQAPEGLLASGNPSSIIMMPSPFWLFAGGLDSLPVLASETLQETTHLTGATAGNVVQTISASQTPTSQTAVSQATVSQAPTSQNAVSQAQTSQTAVSQTPTSQTTVSQTPTSQMPVSQSSVPQAVVSANIRLQTGIYSREANAQIQAVNLRQAGFSPSIEQRAVNGREMWVVTVPTGSDVNNTIDVLRTAGFDSFPIR